MKFREWCQKFWRRLRQQPSVGLKYSGTPYERMISQNVEAECSSQTESIRLKYIFSQTLFMYVKLRIISDRSRCLLVLFSASLENVLVNKLVFSQHKLFFSSLFASVIRFCRVQILISFVLSL